MICVQHRCRVKDRRSDIAGLTPPTWQSVLAHEYVLWTEPRFVIDTAILTPNEAMERVEQQMHCNAVLRPERDLRGSIFFHSALRLVGELTQESVCGTPIGKVSH